MSPISFLMWLLENIYLYVPRTVFLVASATSLTFWSRYSLLCIQGNGSVMQLTLQVSSQSSHIHTRIADDLECQLNTDWSFESKRAWGVVITSNSQEMGNFLSFPLFWFFSISQGSRCSHLALFLLVSSFWYMVQGNLGLPFIQLSIACCIFANQSSQVLLSS